MGNGYFEGKIDKKSNVVEITPKLGRNDLCYCGSGKKYKNCCMKKDQEEVRIEELLQQTETVSDKYFTVKEYIELSGYPITKFDFFLLEIINITGSTLYKYNKTTGSETKEIIKELVGFGKEFHKACSACENGCIKNPLKKANFKELIDNGFDINELPAILQKETNMNFFYIEFINGFSSELEEKLCKLISKEIADDIATSIYWSILDYVADNCYEKCNNECITEHKENAYCKFCSFGSKKLLCPKDGEITYEAVKALPADMVH